MIGFLIFVAIIVLVVYLIRSNNKKRLGGKTELIQPKPKEQSERIHKNISKNESKKFCAVVDIETTGLIKDRDLKPSKSNLYNFPYITEIGWGVFSENGEVLAEGNYLIKQKYPIPKKAIEINGITNEKCEKDGHDLSEILQKFASDINGCLRIVGHNVMFDKRILEAEYIREELPKPFKGMTNYDTMTMGKNFCGMEKWPKLGDLYEEITGKSPAEYKSHRTMGDVAMTTEIFFYLKNRGKLHSPRASAEV